MLIPKSGRLVRTRGSTAQCTAQTSDVAIPKPSQLTCSFMIRTNILPRNQVAKYIFATFETGRIYVSGGNFDNNQIFL